MTVAGIVKGVSEHGHLTRRHRHGKDRPGLVEALSKALAHHGHWLESRIAGLGGRFAGVLLASVPET
ncbi:MAG: ACT domain-containing protein [Gammaproteobacteria bacterium]